MSRGMTGTASVMWNDYMTKPYDRETLARMLSVAGSQALGHRRRATQFFNNFNRLDHFSGAAVGGNRSTIFALTIHPKLRSSI